MIRLFAFCLALASAASNVRAAQPLFDGLLKSGSIQAVPKAAQRAAPAPQLAPGKDFSPKIYDEKRSPAIAKLLADIYYGRQLPFQTDGIVFYNKEKRLPQKPQGYYQEYTLLVPGRQTGDKAEPVKVGDKIYTAGPMLGKRGAERIVLGGGGEHIYYSPDHYSTFIELTIIR